MLTKCICYDKVKPTSTDNHISSYFCGKKIVVIHIRVLERSVYHWTEIDNCIWIQQKSDSNTADFNLNFKIL